MLYPKKVPYLDYKLFKDLPNLNIHYLRNLILKTIFGNTGKIELDFTRYSTKIQGLEVYDWLWVILGRLYDFTTKMPDLQGLAHVYSIVWIFALYKILIIHMKKNT